MRLLVSSLALMACVARAAKPEPSLGGDEVLHQFERWAEENQWTPSADTSFQQALRNFAANQQVIRRLRKEEPYAEFGNTQFAYMSQDEFAYTKLMRAPVEVDPSEQTFRVPLGNASVPDAIDWRELGAVAPVRDQGMCGACWAVSAVGALEGANYIANERRRGRAAPTPLSVEQFLECDDENFSCYGGFMDKAFHWAMQAGGVVADSVYPETRQTVPKPRYGSHHVICLANQTFNATCPVSIDAPCTDFCDLSCELDLAGKHPIHARVASFEKLARDEEGMKRYLATRGPLAVGINASPLHYYKKGIVSSKSKWVCSPDRLNHGVLIVGYGEETVKSVLGKRKRVPYWLVKNSWGPKWGEGGYFRVKRGEGICGIERFAVGVSVVEEGDAKFDSVVM